MNIMMHEPASRQAAAPRQQVLTLSEILCLDQGAAGIVRMAASFCHCHYEIGFDYQVERIAERIAAESNTDSDRVYLLLCGAVCDVMRDECSRCTPGDDDEEGCE